MIIPIPMKVHDSSIARHPPRANQALILLNFVCYLLVNGPSWCVGPGSGPLSILTYAFAHANWWHLLFNMWTLWVFGNPVNHRVGNSYYLAIYLGSAIAVGLIARLFATGPLLGSSGAVFAVMGAALMLLPSVRVDVDYLAFFPLTLAIGLIRKPAYPLFWFLRWGSGSLGMAVLLVAFLTCEIFGFLFFGLLHWGLNWTNTAHLLGFVCGIVIVLLLPTGISMRAPARFC